MGATTQIVSGGEHQVNRVKVLKIYVRIVEIYRCLRPELNERTVKTLEHTYPALISFIAVS